MNYRTIIEPFNKTFGRGRLMYLVPVDIDESDLLKMQVCKELCLCWILLDEGKIALDSFIQEIGVTKTIVRYTKAFHDQMGNQIINMYRMVGGDGEKLIDQMLYDMDCFIYNTISDHYEQIIRI